MGEEMKWYKKNANLLLADPGIVILFFPMIQSAADIRN